MPSSRKTANLDNGLEPFFIFLYFYLGMEGGGGMVDKVNVEAFGCDLMLQIGSFGHLQPFFYSFYCSTFLHRCGGEGNGRKSGSVNLPMYFKSADWPI